MKTREKNKVTDDYLGCQMKRDSELYFQLSCTVSKLIDSLLLTKRKKRKISNNNFIRKRKLSKFM